MATDEIGNEMVRNGSALVAGTAALNQGLIEFLEFDLMTDIVELGSTETQIIVGAFFAAGALVAYNAALRLGD